MKQIGGGYSSESFLSEWWCGLSGGPGGGRGIILPMGRGDNHGQEGVTVRGGGVTTMTMTIPLLLTLVLVQEGGLDARKQRVQVPDSHNSRNRAGGRGFGRGWRRGRRGGIWLGRGGGIIPVLSGGITTATMRTTTAAGRAGLEVGGAVGAVVLLDRRGRLARGVLDQVMKALGMGLLREDSQKTRHDGIDA